MWRGPHYVRGVDQLNKETGVHSMHKKSESDLTTLALNCLSEHEDSDDAWAIFRDEANARYAAIDDGSHAAYTRAAVKIFEAAKITLMDQAVAMADDDDDDQPLVTPPPVINRRTGEKTEFGPRRAFDGAWLLEMLNASGCTRDDVQGAMFVLKPIIEARWPVDEDLLKLLSIFHEWSKPKLTVVK
jgi:hypothetical protein